MTDCAILAIASTTQTVHALVQRIVKDVVLDEQASAVPWTIVNKYYTAKVKFLIHPLSSWTSLRDDLSAPALLFVWNRGEPYRNQIRKLFEHASHHEFEVALAIRLPSTSSTSPAEIEDDQDIDAYLSSEGFEFVDVPGIEPSSLDRTGIPGIPRIIDALSTIMWPSMVRQAAKRLATAGFISTLQSSPSISSDDCRNLVRFVSEKISRNSDDHIQRELEELERWLDEDALFSDAGARSPDGEDEATPWSTAVTPGTLSPSLSGFLENSRPVTPKAGFDDDFASFVSASSADSAGIPPVPLQTLSRSPPLTTTSFSSTFNFNSASPGHLTPIRDDQASLNLTHSVLGESYKSLGSVSDFGDLDKVEVNLERLSDNSDDEGEDLPSHLEIAETSRNILRAVPPSLSPTQERGGGSPRALATFGGVPSQSYCSRTLDVETTDVDLERFDLQSVLGVLQGLKEEIAGMPDKERRKAAARVALGLAYGLDSKPRSAASEELV